MLAYDQSQSTKDISDTVISRSPKTCHIQSRRPSSVFTGSCWKDPSKWIVYPLFCPALFEFCSLSACGKIFLAPTDGSWQKHHGVLHLT